MSNQTDANVRTTTGSADRSQLVSELRRALLGNQNRDGGWAYAAGKRTRLEPTCWGLLALAAANDQPVDVERLRAWPRHDGWLVDVAGAPPNQAFNALAALTLLEGPSAAPLVEPIASNLLAAKGERYPQDQSSPQNNSLQAWSWIQGTASWVEPTAWSLLLFKRLRGRHSLPPKAPERIQVGEQLLLDRVCSVGGWNYGNARVFDHDLWPYVPTTALALLSLRDRLDVPAVRRSIEQMQSDLRTERSALAVALALICLNVYQRGRQPAGETPGSAPLASITTVERDLAWLVARDLETSHDNILGQAIALYALAVPAHAPPIFSF